jgi:acyl carrier protein
MHEAATLSAPDLAVELEVIRHLIAARLERSAVEVFPSQRLHDDLHLGVLGLSVLALEIEDMTGVLVPFKTLIQAVTVEDLARALSEHRRR